MDSFIFAINAVSPLIIMALIGYTLKRCGIISDDVSKTLNKIVFKVFLPCNLFISVYRIESLSGFDFACAGYAAILIIATFLLAIPLVLLITKANARRGVVLQAVFRSNNALIGIPLATSICGAEGAAMAAVISAVAIPVFNILAVISLSIFSEDKGKGVWKNVKRILLGIIKNPLIESVALGFVVLGIRAIFVGNGIEWRLTEITPLFSVLESLSVVATPLALLALGAQFKFSAIGKMKRELIFSITARTIVVPAIALIITYFLFNYDSARFAALLSLLATPVAVSSVPMAQEMGGDYELAGQIAIWSTAVSGITIFLFTFIMKLVGIF